MSSHTPTRILMLTNTHSVLDGRVFHLEARTLARAGYDVTIFAPSQGGEPAERDGVHFLTYTNSARPGTIRRKWITARALMRAAMTIPCDVIHVHEADVSLYTALKAKKRLLGLGKKVKIVYDSHEVWPYFFSRNTSSRWLRKLIQHCVIAWEDWALAHGVDAILTAHTLEENYYLFLDPAKPVAAVLNTPPVEEWGEPAEKSGEIRCIGHDGYFAAGRGMEIILGAFERVARDFPLVYLLAAGDFQYASDRSYFNAWCERTGLRNRVETAGWVDRAAALKYVDRMDIGIVANQPDIHSIRCWPANKMMYYLGRGVAVASTPAPLYKRYMAQNGCGLTSTDFSSESLADVLRVMLNNPNETRAMGQRGYEAAVRDFQSSTGKERLLGLYTELTEKG